MARKPLAAQLADPPNELSFTPAPWTVRMMGRLLRLAPTGFAM